MRTTTLYIKNMVCQCCLRVISQELEKAGVTVNEIMLGKANVSYDPEQVTMLQIKGLLNELGTDLIEGREHKLVEEIKLAVVELIHQMNNVDSIVRKSEYLVEKTGSHSARSHL
ncbi:MAG: hypothetical protein P8100_15165 [bacterium]